MSETRLADAISQYGREAYLLTVSETGPHTSSVRVDLDGETVTCVLGRSAGRNIATQPNVSLFWPPPARLPPRSLSYPPPHPMAPWR